MGRRPGMRFGRRAVHRGVSGAPAPVSLTPPALASPLYVGASPAVTPGTWSGGPSLTYSLEIDGVEVVAGNEAAIEAYVTTLADGGGDAILYEIPNGDDALAAESNTVLVWDPAQMSSAVHWWTGDDLTVVAGTPDKVSAIADQIGTAHITQGTAALRPEYHSPLAVLGQPGPLFVKASSHEMAVTGLSIAAPWSLAIAFAHTSLADNEIVIGGSAGSEWYFRYRTTSGGLWGLVGGAAGEALTTGVTPAADAPYYAILVVNGTSSKIRINGASRFAGATDLGSNTLTAIRLSRSSSFDLPFNGEIGTVIAMSGDITANAADRALLEGYLAARYT